MNLIEKQWTEMSIRNKARVAILGLICVLATCGAIVGKQDTSYSNSMNCSYYTCVELCGGSYNREAPIYGRDEALKRQSACQRKCSRCK